MNSAIYTGEVYHRRYVGRGHTFRYQVFYFLLDLDELGDLDRLSYLFGVNRPAWFSYKDKDHGIGTGDTLKRRLSNTLHEAGYDSEGWSFRVLTMPRMFGYVFNPITIMFCHRGDGPVTAIIYEVNNTYGERIAYLAPVDPVQAPIRQRCEKALFVSPFFELTGHYDFLVDSRAGALHIGIDYLVDEERHLHASFRGIRRPFSASTLRKLAVIHPAMTFKVIAGIHYEAIKLWLHGMPVVRHTRALKNASTGTKL